MKFKEGDSVRIISETDGNGRTWNCASGLVGKMGRITGVTSDCYHLNNNQYGVNFDDSMLEGEDTQYHYHFPSDCGAYSNWTFPIREYGIGLPNNNKKMKITTLVKKLLDSDTRALVEAEYLNGDLELTGNGKDELLTIMFETHKKELVELAKAKIEEAKEDK